MTDTPALAAIHQHVDAAGAKLLLVGDHRQLAAVGAGGGMDLLAQAGARYELTEARRFTHAWEREASLRLRDGDETVLRDYHRHGRLLDAGTVEQAEASAARGVAGRHPRRARSRCCWSTPTSRPPALSAQLRAELVRLGRVEEHGVPLACRAPSPGSVTSCRPAATTGTSPGTRATAAGRSTARPTASPPSATTAGSRSQTLGHGDDGDARGADGAARRLRRRAPRARLRLHRARRPGPHRRHQPRRGHLPQLALAGLYVALTRGRDANTAHVATTSDHRRPGPAAAPPHRAPRPGRRARRRPRPARTRRRPLRPRRRHRVRPRRRERADRRPSCSPTPPHLAATERTAGWLDQLTHDGHLTLDQRARVAAEDGAASLARILRRAELAGHDPRQVLHAAVADRPLDGATQRHQRALLAGSPTTAPRSTPSGEPGPTGPRASTTPSGAPTSPRSPTPPTRAHRELGRDVAEHAPAWAVEALGPVPDGRARPGRMGAARRGSSPPTASCAGHTDHAEALGPAPVSRGQVEAYAAYRAAWSALGRPEIDREETRDVQRPAPRPDPRVGAREALGAPLRRQRAGRHPPGRRPPPPDRRPAPRRSRRTPPTPRAEQARLHREAAEADALAATLDEQVTDLQELDDACARGTACTPP